MRTPVAPRRERFSRLLLIALAIVAVAAGTRSALALFTSTASVPANALATDTLGPPTGLSATGGASVSLSWTATGDSYATGYNVLRGTVDGGPYTQITQVTPYTATTYVDSPTSGTYYYVLQSYAQSWTSANSNQATAGVSTV